MINICALFLSKFSNFDPVFLRMGKATAKHSVTYEQQNKALDVFFHNSYQKEVQILD